MAHPSGARPNKEDAVLIRNVVLIRIAVLTWARPNKECRPPRGQLAREASQLERETDYLLTYLHLLTYLLAR